MASPAPSKRALTAVPARYAKFITALAGNAIAYLIAYGATWHLQAALVGLAASLAVFGVPNAAPVTTVTPVTPAPPAVAP